MKKCKRCQDGFEPSNKFVNYCSNTCKFSRTQSEESKQKLREATLNANRAKGVVPRRERIRTCHQCNKVYIPKWDSPAKPSMFCSRSCVNVHRFSLEGAREAQANKVGEWIDQHTALKRREKRVISKKPPRPAREKQPRQKKIKTCSSCDCVISNRSYNTKYCQDCKKYSLYAPMFIKLNVNIHRNLQTNSELAKNTLVKLYHEMNMSMLDIQRDYKINMNTLHRFAKRKGFKLRTISEGLHVGYAQGRVTPHENVHSTFKHGWHITWEKKRIYFRSSYELDLCNELDQKRTSYDVESLRIAYHDTQKQKTRTALPDFHLPDSNEIIEVKSVYFFNKTNMQDKFREYVKLGYRCKLILEHREYSCEEVLAM